MTMPTTHELDEIFAAGQTERAATPETSTDCGATELPAAADFDERSDVLFFDLETVPDWDAARSIGIEETVIPEPTPVDELPELSTEGTEAEVKQRYMGIVLSPTSTYADNLREQENAKPKPRKGVLAFIDQLAAGSPLVAEREKQIKQLSVCPETCRIVAMGYGGRTGDTDALIAKSIDHEKAVLQVFWKLAKDRQICCYNGIDFDIPVILVRSMKLGVEPSRRFDLRPWSEDVLDIYRLRFGKHSNSNGFGKLKQVAALMGLDVPAGEDSGGDVYRWMLADEWDKIAFYAASDVEILRGLYLEYRGYFF